jgi:hypothetical protein
MANSSIFNGFSLKCLNMGLTTRGTHLKDCVSMPKAVSIFRRLRDYNGWLYVATSLGIQVLGSGGPGELHHPDSQTADTTYASAGRT